MNYHEFTNASYLNKLLQLQISDSDEKGGRSLNSVQEHVLWLKENILNNSSKHHILDLGCGIGHYTRELAKVGYQCTGIDISKKAIEFAINNTDVKDNCEFIAGNFYKYNFIKKYDFIIAPYSIFNLYNQQDNILLFRKLCNILNPGGKFYFEIMIFAKPTSNINYKVWESTGDSFYGAFPYIGLVKECWTDQQKLLSHTYYIINQLSHKLEAHLSEQYYYEYHQLVTMLYESGFVNVTRFDKPIGANVDNGFKYLFLLAETE